MSNEMPQIGAFSEAVRQPLNMKNESVMKRISMRKEGGVNHLSCISFSNII